MPKTIIVTGSGGLIGAEASRYFSEKGYDIVGIDNNMRARFFGLEASTTWAVKGLLEEVKGYQHENLDIRNEERIDRLFAERSSDITAVIHTAAQPSHDWAAKDPFTDFSINAGGTLNLLECVRKHAPEASFIFTSTNKVYGSRPNQLPLKEESMRFELYGEQGGLHPGIGESMPVDQTKHSLFGVSKLSADLLVQEYGRYFNLKTVCFRGGCLTGGGHSGTEMHGFLSYLMKCAMTGKEYRIYGYKGKQVRDNIHSRDLIAAFAAYLEHPRIGAVYNIGGGRHSNCSLIEAKKACEERTGNMMKTVYDGENRKGDHIWYISDLERFQRDYPEWNVRASIDEIYDAVYEGLLNRV